MIADCYIIRETTRKGARRITNNIAEIRKANGLTQQELASRLNLKQSAISMIESGKRNPSISVLFKLAAELDVKVDELMQKAG